MVTFYFRPIKILAVFTACVEFVSGWPMATCAELYIDTLGGLDLDGSTDKNLPYFVVENLATLVQGQSFSRHGVWSEGILLHKWHYTPLHE